MWGQKGPYRIIRDYTRPFSTIKIFSQSVSLTQYVVLSVCPSACPSVCSSQLHSHCGTPQLGDALTTAPARPLFHRIPLSRSALFSFLFSPLILAVRVFLRCLWCLRSFKSPLTQTTLCALFLSFKSFLLHPYIWMVLIGAITSKILLSMLVRS